MTMWVKICGNTSLEDAQLAADAGADAVGFVFANGPRRVSVDHVAAITPKLPAALEKIGVFVDTDLETIAATVRRAGLTGVQLHFGSNLAAALRARFGPGMRILQVIHFGDDAADRMAAAAGDPNLDGILVDSRTASAVGGTGIPFDWQSARQTLFAPGNPLKLIVAGGLSPANVAEAIALLQPWGVDVVTGVEASPGRKDPAKVRDFIAIARA